MPLEGHAGSAAALASRTSRGVPCASPKRHFLFTRPPLGIGEWNAVACASAASVAAPTSKSDSTAGASPSSLTSLTSSSSTTSNSSSSSAAGSASCSLGLTVKVPMATASPGDVCTVRIGEKEPSTSGAVGGTRSEGRRSRLPTTSAAFGVNLAATDASTASNSPPVAGVFVDLRRSRSTPRPGVCSQLWRTGRCRSTEPTPSLGWNLTDRRRPGTSPSAPTIASRPASCSIERMTAAPLGVAPAASAPSKASTAAVTTPTPPDGIEPGAPVAGVFWRAAVGVLEARRPLAQPPGVCSCDGRTGLRLRAEPERQPDAARSVSEAPPNLTDLRRVPEGGASPADWKSPNSSSASSASAASSSSSMAAK